MNSKSSSHRRSRSAHFCTFFLLLATFVSAQTDTGSIIGIVKDEDEHAMSDVSVEVRHRETGIEIKSHTSADGTFYLPTLRPGKYDLTATLEGFGATRQKDILVNVGSRITINIIILPRKEEVVEVEASHAIDTTRSQISQLVSQRQIQDLPLNGRNFLELAFLTPGNFPAPTFDPSKVRVMEVASPGSNGRGGNVMVDGVDDNDDFVGGVLQNFSQEAIGEFQVVSGRFSAETGRTGSSAINVITKSGTNDLHGSGFIFYREDSLQAKNPLLSQDKTEPSFDRQQTGFTLGGPMIRDKAFWFASLEYLNEDGAVSAVTRDVVNRQIDSVLAPTPVDELLLTFRADWKISNSSSFFGRYAFQGNTIASKGYVLLGATPPSDISNFQEATNHLHSGVFGWTKLSGGNLINELRLLEMNFLNSIDSQAEPPELVFPSIVTGKNSLVPQRTRLNRFQIRDDLTFTTARHLIKVGGEVHRLDTNFLFGGFTGGSVYLEENFVTEDNNGDGVIDDNDIHVNLAIRNIAEGTGLVPNVDNLFLAIYIQDDWQVREGLTLNLGLRYELDTQANGANELNEEERVHFYPNDEGIRERDKNNFGPRLGFAWDVKNDGTVLVRGGYGLYYDRITLQFPGYERLLNGEVVHYDTTGSALLGDPFSGSPVDIFGVEILSNHMQNPRIQQFSIGTELRLSQDLAISADYIGSRGDHFLTMREVNHPRTDIQVNPDISSSVLEVASTGDMSYDGLLITAYKRLTSDFQVQASYTLARLENWHNDEQYPLPGFDAADPSKDSGRAEHQDTHRFVLNGIYLAPHDFQISGIFTYASGIPFEIKTLRDFLGDGYSDDRFPLLPRNAGGSEVQTGAQLNEWIHLFNTSNDPAIVAMRQQCGCTLPLVDPNLKFTDNFINLDLRFSKIFTIGKFQLEPILEMFNVLNITNIRGTQVFNLSGYQTNMEAPDFGKPVSTAGGAFGQGGPFAVQVALRFRF